MRCPLGLLAAGSHCERPPLACLTAECGLPRVVSHSSSAGQFVPEGRVPGPELCSVPTLPPVCPFHSPDFCLSQPKACVGASAGLRQHPVFCLLHTYFPFPGIPPIKVRFSFLFFFFSPGSQTAHRTIKTAPLRYPEPSLHYTFSRLLLYSQRLQALLRLHS